MSETREGEHAQKERDQHTKHEAHNERDAPNRSDNRDGKHDRQSRTERDSNGRNDKERDQKPKTRWPLIIAAVLILGGVVGGFSLSPCRK